jgi:hypothetical protein
MIFKHLPVGSARFKTLFLTMTAALMGMVDDASNYTLQTPLPLGTSARSPVFRPCYPCHGDSSVINLYWLFWDEASLALVAVFFLYKVCGIFAFCVMVGTGGCVPRVWERRERHCKRDRKAKKNSGAANKIYLYDDILFFGFLARLLKEHVLSFGFLVQSKRSHTDLKIHKH